MSDTLVLNPMFGFEELSSEELLEVDGGVIWANVGAGLALASAIFIGIACAPAAAFVGAAYVALSIGVYSGALGAGLLIGSGLTNRP
jgi:hypothetical protein